MTTPHRDDLGSAPLTRWHRTGLVLLLASVVLLGGVVELRSAFLKRPLTDLLVYLRAAWAVRIDVNPYRITDHNGWHYNYPPLLAIVLMPLADPPPAVVDRSGYLPYPVTVAVWFLLNVGCLVWGVHTLARALEETSTDERIRGQPSRCRRWWALRVLPVLACLAPIGHTLMRGQVNLLLLALLCGMAAATLRGRRFRAGLFLAGAICIKIIPAFLLLFPLWRRDGRGLLGCAVGLLIGLVAVPLAVCGPERTATYYSDLGRTVLLPGLGGGGDQSRAAELISENGSHSQSLVSTLHNTLHRDAATRPAQANPTVRRVHWLLGAALTLLTLAMVGVRPSTGRDTVLFLGLLTLLMLVISPVSHLHYFCLAVPALLALVAAAQEQSADGRTSGATLAVLLVYLIANLLPLWPRLEWLRDLGPAMFATLFLWGLGLRHLGLRPTPATPVRIEAWRVYVPSAADRLRGEQPTEVATPADRRSSSVG